MRIVFYSTNSNVFDDKTFLIDVMPSNKSVFEEFCAAHSDDEFFCVTQKPGMFLPEFEGKCSNVQYQAQETDTDSFADFGGKYGEMARQKSLCLSRKNKL